MPILAVLDWSVFGPERVRQSWWTPLSWLILPIGYLGVYDNVSDRNGKPLYPFLDPAAGNFWSWVGIMIAVFLAVAYLIWLVGRARLRTEDPAFTR